MTDAGESHLDVNQAIKSFFQDPDWLLKTGIGGTLNALCLVLTLINPLFIPIVFALMAMLSGYVLRVIRYQTAKSGLPAWNNWLDLFMSGLSWLAIKFGLYLLFTSIVTVSLFIGAGTGAIKMYDFHFLGWAIPSIFLSCLSWLIASFFSHYLMVNFALADDISAGFAINKVFQRAVHAPLRFASAWLLALGLSWLAVIVPALSLFGAFLIPSTFFVSEVIGAIMLTQAWEENENRI